MTITEWTENAICKVDKKYLEIKEKHGDRYSLSGYAVFYGPVRENPTFLFIGMNPAGTGKDFEGKKRMLEIAKDKSQPMEYIIYKDSVSNYPIAYRTHRVFKRAGLLKDLRDSVKMNLFFFRSRNTQAMKELPEYEELELFCQEIIKEAVEEIRPKVIIAEGVKLESNDTFNRVIDTLCLRDYIDVNTLKEKISERRNGRRMIYKSCFLKDNYYNIKRINGIIHLSRPISSNEEMIIVDSLKGI